MSGPAIKRDLYVLADGSGRSLAFGPGHVAGTPLPGTPGTSVIGGHRDTHFSVLRHAQPGDVLTLETADGRRQDYTIGEATIVDERDARIEVAGDHPRLLLVTCFPFDAIVPGGPLRYLVAAHPL